MKTKLLFIILLCITTIGHSFCYEGRLNTGHGFWTFCLSGDQGKLYWRGGNIPINIYNPDTTTIIAESDDGGTRFKFERCGKDKICLVKTFMQGKIRNYDRIIFKKQDF